VIWLEPLWEGGDFWKMVTGIIGAIVGFLTGRFTRRG